MSSETRCSRRTLWTTARPFFTGDARAERVAVEGGHGREVVDHQVDVVDPFDHGSAPWSRSIGLQLSSQLRQASSEATGGVEFVVADAEVERPGHRGGPGFRPDASFFSASW